MTKYFSLCCLMVVITMSHVFIRCALSEEPAQMNASAMTLKEVVSLALTNNKDIQAAQFLTNEAQGRLIQAGLFPNPEIEFATNTDTPFKNEGEYSASAGFKQRFPVSGRLSKAENVARVDVAMALAEIRDKERVLIGEVSSKARTYAVLEEKIADNEKLQKTTKELVQVLDKRLKVAEVSETDLNFEKLELQKLSLSLATLLSERDSVRASLNTLLNRDPALSISIEGSLYNKELLKTLNDVAADAQSRRPDRQLAALSIDRTLAEISLAKAGRWEDWTIGFGYNKDKSSFSSPIGTKEDQFLGLSLSVPLPFWNRNQGKIFEVKASKNRAELQLEATDLKIKQEISSSQAKVQRLNNFLTEYSSSLSLAERNLSLLNNGYSEGLIGITSLIQGQQQLNQIRTSFLEIKGDFLTALSDFETASASSSFLNSNEVK